MLISRLDPPVNKKPLEHAALSHVTPSSLRSIVEALNYPRHYVANREANERARDWICEELRCAGYDVQLDGKYDNIIAKRHASPGTPPILLGAHYDTVPTTPGADDNNSAIAVCLEAAKALAIHSDAPVLIAIFNREEDGLLGSIDYVERLGDAVHKEVSEAHIFEMVGYYTDTPGSQSKPANLPVSIPDTGNFLGLLSNSTSNKIASQIFRAAKQVDTSIPLVSLKTYFGVEKLVSDLLRSDHTPFWQASVPAIMWTDTSNFRNPNYHAPTDTPDTLDYDALADVTRIIIGHVLNSTKGTA